MIWQLGTVLALASLFGLGSIVGWVLELLFRRFLSKKNPERKWLNPGFCVGPYIPLYGTGLVILYVIAYWGYFSGFDQNVWSKILLFVIMALLMTVVELIAGLITYYGFHMRLWDYTNEWGNFKGLICPKFSLIWGVLSAVFYFLIFPPIAGFLIWFNNHLQFGFFVGLFWGIFIIDVIISSGAAVKIRAYAKENNVIVSEQDAGFKEAKKVGALSKGFVNFLFNSRVDSVDKQKDEMTEQS